MAAVTVAAGPLETGRTMPPPPPPLVLLLLEVPLLGASECCDWSVRLSGAGEVVRPAVTAGVVELPMGAGAVAVAVARGVNSVVADDEEEDEEDEAEAMCGRVATSEVARASPPPLPPAPAPAPTEPSEPTEPTDPREPREDATLEERRCFSARRFLSASRVRNHSASTCCLLAVS